MKSVSRVEKELVKKKLMLLHLVELWEWGAHSQNAVRRANINFGFFFPVYFLDQYQYLGNCPPTPTPPLAQLLG